MTMSAACSAKYHQPEYANPHANSAAVPVDRPGSRPATLERPPETAPGDHPNLYFQLSQILEWEIWNHSQTRDELCAEQQRRNLLEGQMWHLASELAQWQAACQEAYAMIDAHRAEQTILKQGMDGLSLELLRSQHRVGSNWFQPVNTNTDTVPATVCPRCRSARTTGGDGKQ
jgi:hypothetical protein